MPSFSNILEVIALIFSLVAFKATRPVFLRILTLLLFITVVNEIFIIPYIPSHNFGYNIFSFIDMLVWFYVFFNIHTNKRIKCGIVIAAIFCFSYSFIELEYISGWYVMHINSFRLYELCIIAFSTLYFYEINKKDYHNLFTDPLFWFCSACFIFHLLLFLNFTTINEKNYWHLQNSRLVFLILQTVAITFYYVLICIAFSICYYKYKETHQKF